MSLCLCTLHKDFISISGDSRGSYFYEGHEALPIATTDNCQKIFHIGDKVIFVSGFFELMTNIINDFEKSINQTVNELAKISKIVYEKWKIDYPDLKTIENGRAAELIVATIENGKCVIYSISSFDNDFSPQRYEGGSNPIPITLGTHAIEALKDLKYKLYNKLNRYISDNKTNFSKMFLDIYSTYADEEMGGYMKFYSVMKENIISKEKVMIPDHREIRRINLKCQHCSVGQGFQIDQNIGTKENPIWDNVVYIDNSGNFTIDGGWIKLLTQNNENQIKIDPEVGIEIRKSGVKNFYIDIEGNVIFSGTLKGANGTFTGKVDAGIIEGGIINGAEINGGTINVDTNVTVGNTLRIGSPADSSNKKSLYFNNSVNFSTYSAYIPGQYGLSLSCNRFELYGVSALEGDWHFSNAYVTGLENSGYLKGSGVSGSFETVDGQTITVSDGLIVDIT